MERVDIADDLRTLTQEFYDGVNRGDMSVVDTHVADDFVDHEKFPGQSPDKEGVRQFFATLRDAFPDLRVSVEDVR